VPNTNRGTTKKLGTFFQKKSHDTDQPKTRRNAYIVAPQLWQEAIEALAQFKRQLIEMEHNELFVMAQIQNEQGTINL
jgi:hypothetical protein